MTLKKEILGSGFRWYDVEGKRDARTGISFPRSCVGMQKSLQCRVVYPGMQSLPGYGSSQKGNYVKHVRASRTCHPRILQSKLVQLSRNLCRIIIAAASSIHFFVRLPLPPIAFRDAKATAVV